MEYDYYEILGVSADADLETIRKAYRIRAMEYHPDRGGLHEKMILINEAWEILSDPVKRQHYDYARANRYNRKAQQTATVDAAQARQRAQEYPRKWVDFEAWLNRFSDDFTTATYSSVKGPWGTRWPTAGSSISGWMCIIIGGILGLVFVGIPLVKDSHIHGGFAGLMAVGLPTLGGAWLGAVIHAGIGRFITKSGTQFQSKDYFSHIIITCENCGQKLRVPELQRELRVKCLICNHRFLYTPSAYH